MRPDQMTPSTRPVVVAVEGKCSTCGGSTLGLVNQGYTAVQWCVASHIETWDQYEGRWVLRHEFPDRTKRTSHEQK